ncbi:MAG: hypothetical protein N3A66_10925, partial [Planctomycetota bacterium]|nr:hypothetical protein [Planctomycetota bacterium]
MAPSALWAGVGQVLCCLGKENNYRWRRSAFLSGIGIWEAIKFACLMPQAEVRSMRKNDVACRQERWRRFLAPAAKPGFLFLVNWPSPPGSLPQPPPARREFIKERIEYKWLEYQHALWRSGQVDDDRVPCINMMTSTEIFAEAFGCQVHYPENSNPFALPLIHRAAEVAKIKVPELSRSTLACHFEMADELRRRAGPEAVFHMVDIQSPMDIAALVWEKSSFYLAMLDEPLAVRDLAEKTRQLLVAFLDEWFKRYGREFVAHYPDYYMPGGITLSEDEIGAVNSEIFEELFRPELEYLSQRYGGIGIHCCADARHQWPGIKNVRGLRLLNLVKPPVRGVDHRIINGYVYISPVPVKDGAEIGSRVPHFMERAGHYYKNW